MAILKGMMQGYLSALLDEVKKIILKGFNVHLYMFKFEVYMNIILLWFQQFILFERMFRCLVVFSVLISCRV